MAVRMRNQSDIPPDIPVYPCAGTVSPYRVYEFAWFPAHYVVLDVMDTEVLALKEELEQWDKLSDEALISLEESLE